MDQQDCLAGKSYFLTRLMTQVLSAGLTMWKQRTNSGKLSSRLHTLILIGLCPYNFNECLKNEYRVVWGSDRGTQLLIDPSWKMGSLLGKVVFFNSEFIFRNNISKVKRTNQISSINLEDYWCSQILHSAVISFSKLELVISKQAPF